MFIEKEDETEAFQCGERCSITRLPPAGQRGNSTSESGTVAKKGVFLSPLHLSYRSSTIPASPFLFLYNEGL